MTTTIANPIYDLAFKYLMEDECVVKILLSALLRKQADSRHAGHRGGRGGAARQGMNGLGFSFMLGWAKET